MTPTKKPVPPLTDEEILELRERLQELHRVKWVQRQIKTFFISMVGFAAGIITLSGAWDAIAAWLRKN